MNHPSHKSKHLLCIQYTDGIRTIRLQKDYYRIGRDRQNEIVLLDTMVSRFHAILVRVLAPGTKNYCYRVIDGDDNGTPSKNGIYINQEQCCSKELENGDLIAFANIYASYHIPSDSHRLDEEGEEEASTSVKAYAALPKDRHPTNPGLSIGENHLEQLELATTTNLYSQLSR